MNNNPSIFIRNIALDIILTLVTFGIYNIYIQYQQILALNQMLGSEKYSFIKWFLLSIITLGFYHIYHEYRMSVDLAQLMDDKNYLVPITVLLAFFGLVPVCDAIQQTYINRFFGSTKV